MKDEGEADFCQPRFHTSSFRLHPLHRGRGGSISLSQRRLQRHGVSPQNHRLKEPTEVTGMSLRKLYAPALLFSLTLLSAPCVLAQSDARAQAAAEIESLRAQIKVKEAVLLSPSKGD